jgi:hypothetical protein
MIASFTRKSAHLACILVITTSIMPVLAQAQENVGMACSDAQRDAKQDVSGGTYFLFGLLAPVITYIVVSSSRATPPASRLIGKSPEYVAVYSDCYSEAAEKTKKNATLAGCLVGLAAWTALIVIIVASDDSGDYYY